MYKSSIGSDDDDVSLNEVATPLDMVRTALLKLNDLDQETVPEISLLLQVSRFHL